MISVSGYLLVIFLTLFLCLTFVISLLYIKIAIFFNLDKTFKSRYLDFIEPVAINVEEVSHDRTFYNSVVEDNDVIKTVSDGFKLMNSISWYGRFIV
jgi:hypothetical protein